MSPSPSICPSCGASLPIKAESCKECGSDYKTGWKSISEIEYDSVELPEEGDYEEFLEREGLRSRPSSRRKIWLLIVGLLLIFALFLASIM